MPPMAKRAVFLDIGAHWGETLEEALSPVWRFDVVYAFEPDPEAVAIISQKFAAELASGKLILVPAALSNRDGEADLFGGNEGGGASLYAEKTNIDAAKHETVKLISSSAFFAEHFNGDDLILAKLNCEGGEVDILQDLSASGEIQKIARLVVDFDIRKVRGKRGLARATIAKMRAAGFDRFLLTENVMIGADARARTRNAIAHMPEAHPYCAEPAALPNPPRRPKWTRRVKTLFRYL
jgi:FkbM family methyltransferase